MAVSCQTYRRRSSDSRCDVQSLKNRILLENCYVPGDLKAQIEAFVADYNHRCYHESDQGASAPRREMRTVQSPL